MSRIEYRVSSIVGKGSCVLLAAYCSLLFAMPVFAAGPDGVCASTSDCTEGDCGVPTIGCYCSSEALSCVRSGSAGTACTTDHSRITPDTDIAAQCRPGLTCTTGRCTGTTPPASPTAPDVNAAPVMHTPIEYGYRNPLGTTNIRTIINRVIRGALGFVGALFLAMFIYGGALWMTAAGDEKKVQRAKTTLANAVIGLIVISFSYLIISFIFQTAATIRG